MSTLNKINTACNNLNANVIFHVNSISQAVEIPEIAEVLETG